MANTFLSANHIARKALPILINNLVFQRLVYTDYSNDYTKQGDTIQVRKPAAFTAQEFGTSVSSYQDATETAVLVQMDKLKSVDVKVTAKELTLSLENFTEQITRPAMEALAQDVDSELADLYKEVPYFFGTAAVTPATLSNFAGCRRVMNVNKAMVIDRRVVMDPYAEEQLGQLDSLVAADKSGTTTALRQGSLGRILGFDTFMDQNIKTHTKGTLTAVATGTGSAGVQSLTIKLGITAQTLVAGDIITFSATSGTYVVLTTLTLTGTTGTATIYPALPSAVTDEVITVVASHVASLAFQRLAFGYVSRPLAPPMAGAKASTMNFRGLSIQVVLDYDMDAKTNVISYNILFGTKTLYPELACRMVG